MSEISGLENRVIEVLDAIREVLNRLATLEEKTGWHNQVMTDLGRGQKELVDRVSSLELDKSRVALLERDLQYITGEVSKSAKQVELLTAIVHEIQLSDKSQGKTVGLIENLSSSFLIALVGAAAGAVSLKIFGG